MPERTEPESVEERNLRRIVASALLPAAPPLAPGLPTQLAARARQGAPGRIDLPLAAAASAAGLLLLAFSRFLPSERTDLRVWTWLLPAANFLLGPIAALVVICDRKGGAFHAKT
jgi:hypothetical protein